MRFLFWNIKRNPLGQILAEVVQEHGIEVVILAECPDKMAILQSLNTNTDRLFYLTDSKTTRVVIYTRFPIEFIQPEHHDKFLTVRRMNLLGRKEILLAAAHLPSKLWSTSNPEGIASLASKKIRDVEEKVGHSRTVLVGDLNMNPFEERVTSAEGLHAVMTRDIAKKKARNIHKESYPFFYNPMWSRFGDATQGPPGTYYRAGSSFMEYFWHTYDQVLIRPSLLDLFDTESVKVLVKRQSRSFLRQSGVPDAARISDHLPLLFDLRI